jgi:hypothetical protein
LYNVSVTNNYIYSLFLNGGNEVIAQPNGGRAQFTDWGSNAINVAWMGDINFIDLGDQKLSGYTNPELPWTENTWGGLVRYQGLDAYFRYEGQGQVELVVDRFGSVSLHFEQGGMVVSLDDLTVD